MSTENNSQIEQNQENTSKKPKKTQGPIRWNAIIPFALFSLLVYGYFVIFFDLHVKNLIEWTGYTAIGTEVNVGSFKSSFTSGYVHISKIEITNRSNPNLNTLEIGSIKFDVNWDALLRVKFVIEEISTENIQFMSKRSHPGKVAPPKPPSNEPSLVDEVKGKALNKLAAGNSENLLGDIVAFLKGGDVNEQIKGIESQLNTKTLIQDLNKKWNTKQTEWNTKAQTLPKSEDLTNLQVRFEKIKYKDFSSVQELENSVKEAQAISDEINTKVKHVQNLKNEFDQDLKTLDQDKKSIENEISKDISFLKDRFKIPKIDAGALAKSLFMDYLTPYLQKIEDYKNQLKTYLPPKFAKMLDSEKKEKSENEIDDTIQPLPRSKGVVYEFPIKNGYPLFWIQKIKISSKSNANVDYGDFDGLINDITSNQRQIGRPTRLSIKGDFKKASLIGIEIAGELNNLAQKAIVDFGFNIASYPLENFSLINSDAAKIVIPKSISKFALSAKVIDFKNFDINFNNSFSDVGFEIGAKDQTLDEILKNTLGTINSFDLQASLKGELKNLDVHIKSSLASDLERSFQSLLQNKINEANAQLQKAINAEIDKIRSQFQEQIDSFKKQVESEIKKAQQQLETQKKEVEQKIEAAKKDFENQVNAQKKEAENKLQEQIKKEGQKKLDDLKKGLGL